MNQILCYLLLALSLGCSSDLNNTDKDSRIEISADGNQNADIAQYVVETFQDSKGNLWFGTLEKGIAKFNGEELIYLTNKDGLPSNRIVCAIEDKDGNLWFGTGLGISKFDGNSFTNYSEDDGLCSNAISNLFIDSEGILWIGSWAGLCTYDGQKFEKFNIPYPEVSTKLNKDTKDWITGITEDNKGNILISRDGFGLAIFDGENFQHILKKDGLYSNFVTDFQVDDDGKIWIASRVAEKDNPNPEKREGPGGISVYDGNSIRHFPDIPGLNNADIYEIYMDKSGDIWIGTLSHGVYKFNDSDFENYDVPISLMGILEDNNGVFWFGGAGGLYMHDKKGQINKVNTSGPWN